MKQIISDSWHKLQDSDLSFLVNGPCEDATPLIGCFLMLLHEYTYIF